MNAAMIAQAVTQAGSMRSAKAPPFFGLSRI